MTVRFVRDRNNERVFGQIRGLEKLTRQGLRRGMFRAGQALRAEASRAILKDPKTGIVYIRRDRAGRLRRHMSSAPGETHANLSGALRRSLSYQLHGATEIEFGYGVSSGKTAPDYAKFVEFGTTRMKARPSLRNTLKSQQKNLTQHFENGIKGAFK